MKSVYFAALTLPSMLNSISDAAAHETLGMAHSHELPTTLLGAGFLSTLLIVAFTVVCLCMAVSVFRRSTPRTD